MVHVKIQYDEIVQLTNLLAVINNDTVQSLLIKFFRSHFDVDLLLATSFLQSLLCISCIL